MAISSEPRWVVYVCVAGNDLWRAQSVAEDIAKVGATAILDDLETQLVPDRGAWMRAALDRADEILILLSPGFLARSDVVHALEVAQRRSLPVTCLLSDDERAQIQHFDDRDAHLHNLGVRVGGFKDYRDAGQRNSAPSARPAPPGGSTQTADLPEATRSPALTRVDFVLVTALEEERDALLELLPEHRQLPPSQDDVRVYFRADLAVTFADATTARYRLVVLPLVRMGRLEAAQATGDAIRRWRPRNVVLLGIAGGFSSRGVQLGDILVADQIVDYELQKVTPEGPEVRYTVHRADESLFAAASNYRNDDWVEEIGVRRPLKGQPRRHIGPIATGDKVDAFNVVQQRYGSHWPQLIGVEMEAGGVARACFQAMSRPGFFMIRAVSDLADKQKDSPHVKRWRTYACQAAAAYTVALLRTGPVLPV